MLDEEAGREAAIDNLKAALVASGSLVETGTESRSPEHILDELAKHNSTRPYYIARSLAIREKYDCLFCNYSHLIDTLSIDERRTLYRDGVSIWSSRLNDVDYSAFLKIEPRHSKEGELSLEFRADGRLLYTMSFSIVPGYLVAAREWEALLISRMQGCGGRFEEVRQATKSIGDISPQAVLFAVLGGVAKALGIETIAGVSASNHRNFNLEKARALEQQYDVFFQSIGASGPVNGFYVYATSMAQRPINHTKAGHRLRTRRKRSIKQDISDAVVHAWPRLFPFPAAAEPADRKAETSSPEPERLRSLARLNQHRTLMAALEASRSEVAAVRAENERLRLELQASARAMALEASARLGAANRAIGRLAASRLAAAGKWPLPLRRRSLESRILASGLFDEAFYLAKYPDVSAAGLDPATHYLEIGAKEGRDPNAHFSTEQYMRENPDVARSRMNPLLHYFLHGALEGRNGIHNLASGPIEAARDAGGFRRAGSDAFETFAQGVLRAAKSLFAVTVRASRSAV